jgi:hypothetical protein
MPGKVGMELDLFAPSGYPGDLQSRRPPSIQCIGREAPVVEIVTRARKGVG